MDDDILGENDPLAYQDAADRVTADSDQDVWVVQRRRGDEWTVSAVLTSYEDAEAYIEDMRDFMENCPEGAPEEFTRKTTRFRYGSRNSPNKLYESWPPEGNTNE